MWSEAQAIAALRVVHAQDELAGYFEAKGKLTPAEQQACEDRWAETNAREAIREEA